jgi:hypothetical protein
MKCEIRFTVYKCIASPEAYLSFYESDDTYQKMAQDASREAIQVECKAYSTHHTFHSFTGKLKGFFLLV